MNWFLKDKNKQKSQDRSSKPARMAAPDIMGGSETAILRFQAGLSDEGALRATDSGATRVDTATLNACLQHAEAAARELGGSPFDPESNAYDKAQQAQQDVRMRELQEEVRPAIKAAEEEVRTRRDALSNCVTSASKPQPPMLSVLFSTGLMSISLAPTVHDVLLGAFIGGPLAWMVACLPGAFAGLLISITLISTYKDPDKYRQVRLAGFFGGLVFAVAMGVLRFTQVTTLPGMLFGGALTLLEVGIVLLLKSLGDGLRARWQEYWPAAQEKERLARLLQAAETEVNYRKQRAAELEAQMTEFRRELYEREARARQIPTLVAAAKAAIEDGYRKGIAQNQAKLLGVKPTALVKGEADDSNNEKAGGNHE
jgi:hypothetical protein